MPHLLPYKELELYSPLPSEEALSRLSTEIKPLQMRPRMKFAPTDGKFQGSVNGNRFEIRRDIGYRNSFLPFVRGTVMPSGGGSVIRIEMRMHRLSAYFMTAWLGFVTFFFVTFGMAYTHGSLQGGMMGIVIPVLMFLFGVGIMMAGFYPEASIAGKFFRDTLNAQKTDLHNS